MELCGYVFAKFGILNAPAGALISGPHHAS
jgi:hypothetical protein